MSTTCPVRRPFLTHLDLETVFCAAFLTDTKHGVPDVNKIIFHYLQIQ